VNLAGKPDLPARSGAARPAQRASQALFGPPALVAGEDAAVYDELLARVRKDVKPADILEEFWVRDVVDLVWEVLRLRRLKAKVLARATPGALAQVLAPHLCPPPKVGGYSYSVGASPAEVLAARWAAQDPAAIRNVDGLFATTGLTMDHVMAECLAMQLGAIEQIDRMAMSAEVRRSAALRELERHRAVLGEAMRRVVDDAEEAEFAVVAPGAAARSAA
jgi:hypothetical protein